MEVGARDAVAGLRIRYPTLERARDTGRSRRFVRVVRQESTKRMNKRGGIVYARPLPNGRGSESAVCYDFGTTASKRALAACWLKLANIGFAAASKCVIGRIPRMSSIVLSMLI